MLRTHAGGVRPLKIHMRGMKYLLITILSVALFSCTANKGALEEEVSVYKAFLNEEGIGELSAIAIQSNSVFGETVVEYLSRLKGELPEAKKSFVAMNEQVSKIPLTTKIDERVVIVPGEELTSIFGGDRPLKYSWKAFHKKYPDSNGFFGFSRVGFNGSRTEAILYVQLKCGPTCGNGFMVHLKNGVFGWYTTQMVHLWVS